MYDSWRSGRVRYSNNNCGIYKNIKSWYVQCVLEQNMAIYGNVGVEYTENYGNM